MRIGVLVVVIAFTATCTWAEEKKPLWSGGVDASFMATSGNTSGSTLGASGGLTWRPGRHVVRLSGGFMRTVTDRAITSKRMDGALRGERTVVGQFGGYLQMSYYRDIFAGTRNQEVADAGVLYRVFTGDRRSLSVATSFAQTWEEQAAGRIHDYSGIRGSMVTSVAFNSVFGFDTEGNYLYDLSDPENWKIRSQVALIVGRASLLVVKCSYRLYVVHKPESGKRTTDTTVFVSLAIDWPISRKH